MGTRATLLTTGAAILAALPFTVFAATTNFFGPIVPQSGVCLCDTPGSATAMDWGCLLQTFQAVLNFLVSFSLLAVVFFIAWGGFTLITSGGNPSARTQATNRMLNAVVGLVLILGAWLIVDEVMKYLYNPSTAFSGAQFGPWNTILGSDPNAYCLRYNANPGHLTDGGIIGTLISVGNPGLGDSATGATGSGNVPPGPSTRGLCTPSSLQQSGWSPDLAAKMSCVTKFENGSCNPSAPSGTDVGTDGRSVSIGIFQVNISADNLNYPACEALNGGRPLNCKQAFAGGTYTGSNHQTHVADGQLNLYTTCRDAASDPRCNTAAAQNIYTHGGIKNWGTAAQNNCGG